MDYARFVALRRPLWESFERDATAARRSRDLTYSEVEELALRYRQVLQDHATLDSGSLVVLRAETWGLENMSGGFEIWEQDSTSDDDFVLRLDTNTNTSIAQAEWTAVYIDDGALATEAEYYFLGDIGGRACRSPLLIISQ